MMSDSIKFNRPGTCPKCGTESIRTYNLESAEQYQYVRRCKCNHCKCEWSEMYVFERKRIDKAGVDVEVTDAPVERNFLFTVGEVFRHAGKTFYCTTSGGGIVQYLRINEPREDMMFRASDGRLYQYLFDPDRRGRRGCACEAGTMRCDDIQQELFGRDCAEGEIWIPVDEGK